VGRKQTINRETVLSAAERVVSISGAAGLTIDAVAKAANISKGGVQSCFGNKESLIEAMLIRWGTSYDRQIDSIMHGSEISITTLKAHIRATVSDIDSNTSRSAALLSALLNSPGYLVWIQDWYNRKHREFTGDKQGESFIHLIVFLATEGLFFLRYFKLLELSEKEWELTAEEIERLLDVSPCIPPRHSVNVVAIPGIKGT